MLDIYILYSALHIVYFFVCCFFLVAAIFVIISFVRTSSASFSLSLLLLADAGDAEDEARFSSSLLLLLQCDPVICRRLHVPQSTKFVPHVRAGVQSSCFDQAIALARAHVLGSCYSMSSQFCDRLYSWTKNMSIRYTFVLVQNSQ